MVAPLTSLECELLEAIAHDRDPGAMTVLGDYWIEHIDPERGAFVHISHGDNAQRIDLADEEARLAAHAQRWRQLAITAGYPERDLALAGGFLQWPIVVPADHPLDGHPDIVRISPRYYRERAVLRRGRECTVSEAEAITPRTRTRVALKVASYPEVQPIVDHEHAVLQHISHPNVVRTFGYAVTPTGRALALEWCGIDLRKLERLAREHTVPLGVDFALSVGIQLYAGITALHAVPILHRELRSDHVAVAADGTVRIIDFGTATTDRLPRDPRRYVSPGVPGDMRYRLRYMSREQCLGWEIKPSTDVYSAALVIAELASGTFPFPTQATDMDLLLYIRDNQIEPPVVLPTSLRVPLRMAIDQDPERRPTARAMRDMLVEVARMLKLDVGPHVIARRLVELGVPT